MLTWNNNSKKNFVPDLFRQIFNRFFNINNNSKKNFVPDLFQEQVQPIKPSFVPCDEPLKYIDSQHSKQVAVQKRFYQKGLYK